MMVELQIAVRNLLRNKRRSLATLLALAVGTSSVLFFGGYRKNIEYSMLTAYARDTGHFQIQHRDLLHYGQGDPVRYSIAGYERILEAIQRDPVLGKLVRVATPTLQFGGVASNFAEGVSRTVLGFGQLAADRNRMREWNEFDLPMQGEPIGLERAPADGAIIGTGVARVLLLCDALHVANCPPRADRKAVDGDALPADIALLALGESDSRAPAASGTAPRIELLASSAGGAPNVISLTVQEARRQGFRELDEVYLSLQLPMAQRLVYGKGTPMATAIMVQLKATGQMAAAKERLDALLADVAGDLPLVALDFRQLNPFFVQTIQMFNTIFGFIFALIGAIVLFTVGNTMSTTVMERTVEIGTVRALGARRRDIRRQFVLEGILLGVAGSLCGALFALAGSAILNRLGLTWLPPGSGENLPLVLIVWGETATILGTVVGLAAISGFSAWWPARRASRMVIVDALRHA